MKKFKSLKSNQVAYTLHGSSDNYDEYSKELKIYNAKLETARDKEEKNLFKKGVPLKRGVRFTLSAVLDLDSDNCYVGLAICSSEDNFSKELGRKISIDRAVVYRGADGKIKSGSPISEIELVGLSDLKDKDKNAFIIKKRIYNVLDDIRTQIKNTYDFSQIDFTLMDTHIIEF